MKISDFKTFKFTLNLTQPLQVGQQRLTERTGLIIELRSQNDHTALGEISPLPGLSREEIDQVENQVALLRTFAIDSNIPGKLDKLFGGFDNWLGIHNLAPSVRFGFETAILGLIATMRGVPLCELICKLPSPSIRINGLLSGAHDTVMQNAVNFLKKGYTAFKLKVGRDLIDNDVQLTRDVRRLIGDDTTLRLDANRAWSIDDTLAFTEGVHHYMIDYLEEPVHNLTLLRQLLDRRGLSVPLAIDESLLELSPKMLSSLAGIKAMVLKPTLLGFERAMQLARSATQLGIIPVITSTFESGVGLELLSQMAACVNGSEVPAGLDTLHWFQEDLLVNPLRIEVGRLAIDHSPRTSRKIRENMLRITHP